ncbi:hypothetical protein CEXT_545681 [Caerostris extrusa]|uniref:Secreted protein n=1 Tax=Caerostris extrusa TaxID=172846 RepID=A0AAV4NNB0_CAEEX|nr:hypothetical protein CEXT_545681 [Caerostris extrusa]
MYDNLKTFTLYTCWKFDFEVTRVLCILSIVFLLQECLSKKKAAVAYCSYATRRSQPKTARALCSYATRRTQQKQQQHIAPLLQDFNKKQQQHITPML